MPETPAPAKPEVIVNAVSHIRLNSSNVGQSKDSSYTIKESQIFMRNSRNSSRQPSELTDQASETLNSERGRSFKRVQVNFVDHGSIVR